MKEPNIGTPVEGDIRRHFGKLLRAEKEIEIVPHTKVWATVDGVLLWDPKNGYAQIATPDISKMAFVDLGVTRFTPEDLVRAAKRMNTPTSHRSDTVNLKRVVYMTGPKASGKSRLVALMADAVELNRSQYIGFTDLSRSIDKHAGYSTVVICTNDLRPQAFDVNNALAIWCRERKIEYLNINLK